MSEFKIGDKVNVLDENLTGTIVKIDYLKITIEDNDGFDYTFVKSKISPILDENLILKQELNLQKIIQEKENYHSDTQSKKKVEKESIEIDLHIHAITDHSKYLTNYEMLCMQLDTAKAALNKVNPNKTKSIIFIHGIGKGKLKKELEDYLKKEQYIFYPAKYAEYGLGAIEVEIRKKN